MVFKQVLVPDENNHSVEMPEQFFGKKVEITVIELDADKSNHPVPPLGKPISVNELFDNFGADPGFPSVDEIRAKAWPTKW